MQKITEIRETYTVKRKKRDGSDSYEEKSFTRFREVPYVQGWARFGHFLLDYVFFLIFQAILGLTIGIILGLTGNIDLLESPHLDLYERLFNWLILHPFFYFIFEFAMQASPAKAILGRVVVDEYGNKPGAKQIFVRSVSRIVPFEAFSCLGVTGWHDNWSDTFVLRKKDLEELRLLQKINNIDGTSVSLQPQA